METKLHARSMSEHAAMALAMEHLPMAVALFTLDGKAVYMNQRFREFYHPNIDDPIHRFVDLSEYARSGAASNWSVDPQTYFEAARQELMRKGWNRAQLEIDGRIIDVHDLLIDGQIIVTTQKDITDHILAERQMSYLARHDVLTGLGNRAGFEAEAERLHRRMEDENRSFSLLMADLDLFKSINDAHGHAAGDAVLREVGRRFHECLDGQDFAARFGGDEFVFLTPEEDLVVNAMALAQRLAACVAHPVEFEGHSLTIGVTIGYATFPRDAGDIASLTRAADQALYTAKAAGRGSVLAYWQVL